MKKIIVKLPKISDFWIKISGKSLLLGLMLFGLTTPLTTIPATNNTPQSFDCARDCGELVEPQFETILPQELVFLSHNPSPKQAGELTIPITAYSSTPEETDATPFITAAGTKVRHGIVAANFLPFGTKIMIPELFGEQIFVVEDRMARKHGGKIDVWFPSKQQAINFGVQYTKVVILES